jgi:hypothetical protein
MKTFKVLLFVIALFVVSSLKAQVSVNVNIGAPPMWGPVGYSNVQYYYLPDVEAYYDVPSSMFIYQSGGTWIHRSYLPVRYRNYDLYNGYKVVMTDYHGNKPYYHHNDYKVRYAKGYRGPAQKNIGYKHENGHSEGNSQFRNQSYKSSGYSREKGEGHEKSESHGNNNSNKGNGHGEGHEKSNGGGHGKK